jgi:hypothetical protein
MCLRPPRAGTARQCAIRMSSLRLLLDRLMAAYVDILQEHRDMFEIVGAI